LRAIQVIMPRFTIETTYRLPVYRQRTYEAETIEQACRLAIEDDDWPEQKEDYDCSGDTYVTGAWPARTQLTALPRSLFRHSSARTYSARPITSKPCSASSKFSRTRQGGEPSDSPFWRQRADAAIAKAEAILAGASDPVIERGAP
jgi:hypothetical protein